MKAVCFCALKCEQTREDSQIGMTQSSPAFVRKCDFLSSSEHAGTKHKAEVRRHNPALEMVGSKLSSRGIPGAGAL